MLSTKLEKQREYRRRTGNSGTKKYEKTKKGVLMRKYRNMRSRVSGIQKQKAHLYEGLSIVSKDVFYNWALDHPDFHSLYKDWELSGYDRKLSPSVDRIDPGKGYELDNMQWMTHSENSRRGSLSRWGAIND